MINAVTATPVAAEDSKGDPGLVFAAPAGFLLLTTLLRGRNQAARNVETDLPDVAAEQAEAGTAATK